MANETVKELLRQIEKLEKQIDDYRKPKDTNREYKDRLFKFIFGNPDNRNWTLSLYNAINGTEYTDPDVIQFNTIEDAVYMGMRNDISFIVAAEMNLWEHQSTFNPNMPMRFLNYGNRLYEKYMATSDYYLYSSTLQKIPRPICICFYNGTRNEPEKQILRLSQAYDGEGDIEVRITMLNINSGKNRKLMEACEPLGEYAWLVNSVRRHQAGKMNPDAAIDASLEEMPEQFVIKPFLVGNRAEVKSMLLTEYNEEKVLEKERQEGRREGLEEGRQEGRREGLEEGRQKGRREGLEEGRQKGFKEGTREMAARMIHANEPEEKIIAYTGLNEAEIREIRKSQMTGR